MTENKFVLLDDESNARPRAASFYPQVQSGPGWESGWNPGSKMGWKLWPKKGVVVVLWMLVFKMLVMTVSLHGV